MTKVLVPLPQRCTPSVSHSASAVLFFLAAIHCGMAFSQATFPSRNIRVIVASTAGGAMDAIARTVTTKLTDVLGQPVVVDNRGGANGAVAAELTVRSPADGYTLMLGGNGNLAIAPFTNKSLAYAPMTDFAPVTLAASAGQVLVVHPALPVQSVQDLIRLAKAQPGALSFGTTGVGSGQYLAAWIFQDMAKVSFLHVPYRGGPVAAADLVSGQTQLAFGSMTSVAPFLAQKRLRPLAVTLKQRSKVFPELPTISEAGLKGYEATNWYAFVVPAKTPQPVIAQLNKEIVQILQLPQSREVLLRLGIEVVGSTPEALSAYMASELEKWARVVKQAGITE